MRIHIPEHITEKEDVIKYVLENQHEIIALKKMETKIFVKSIDSMPKNAITTKAYTTTNKDTDSTIFRTIVGNTYNWMDNHDDAHFKGTFTKSISETDKIFFYHDHQHMTSAKVGKFDKVYEEEVSWSDYNINKAGTTISLLADAQIKQAYNPAIFEQYKDGEIDQHSVGMIYVQIQLCAQTKEDKKAQSAWDKYYPLLGNQDRADAKGYFFAVTEAKLKEISCVTQGSNELTPTRQLEPTKAVTPNIEPLKDTQQIDFAKLAKVLTIKN